MADEDKLLGIAKKNRSTNYTYTAHRIDYDSAENIADLAPEDTEFSGAMKNPPQGYPGHEAKQDFQRKILVEDDATRDEVTAILSDEGIAYESEDVAPTDDEKAHIEDFGAESSLDGADALAWKRQLEDLEAGNISQVDVERGRNPHRDEFPGRPSGHPGRGRGPK